MLVFVCQVFSSMAHDLLGWLWTLARCQPANLSVLPRVGARVKPNPDLASALPRPGCLSSVAEARRMQASIYPSTSPDLWVEGAEPWHQAENLWGEQQRDAHSPGGQRAVPPSPPNAAGPGHWGKQPILAAQHCTLLLVS